MVFLRELLILHTICRYDDLRSDQHTIAPELRQLNERILLSLASSNRMMNGIVEEYLRTKGKQIRPIMVLLSARLLGTVTPKVISAAASVEMLHNASLIHDDVVDESKLRRNEPTVNGIWDNHIAVLVGDFFVSTALQLAMSTEDLRIVDSLARLGRLLSLGELDQIYNARFHRLDESAYFEIIGRKTASLFISCVEMGCICHRCRRRTAGTPAPICRTARNLFPDQGRHI